jgi:hypothetical protein
MPFNVMSDQSYCFNRIFFFFFFFNRTFVRLIDAAGGAFCSILVSSLQTDALQFSPPGENSKIISDSEGIDSCNRKSTFVDGLLFYF